MAVGHKAFAQKKPDQLVYLELGSGNGGMLLSISEEGFRFRAVSPVRPQSLLPFAFSLDGSQRFEGTGEVEWLEDNGRSGGMRFLEVSSDFRSKLSRWLAADAQSFAGREVVPAAATPLDTMEKIRQELRQNYPAASRAPAREPAEEPAVREPARKRNVQPPPAAEPEIRAPERRERLEKPFVPPPEPPRSSPVNSAFLKPPRAAAEPFLPPSEPVRRPERPRAAEPRPYVPPPDESFEGAWERARERARLSEPPEPPHLSRAAAGSIIGVALAVILGALGFNFRQDIGSMVIGMGQKISGKQAAANPPASALAASKSSEGDLPQESPQDSQRTAPAAAEGEAVKPAPSQAVPAPGPSNGRTATPAGPSSAKPEGSTNTLPAEEPPATAELESGQQEFNQARDILRGEHRQRELWRAVDLLWAGVRKGYVPAEVTLADLYRRGDGVEKNCDQAQVLLVAASKKGSPEARRLLEQMAEIPCE